MDNHGSIEASLNKCAGKRSSKDLVFLEIVFPKYQWATTVDIEASYKSVPEISYGKYDQVYTSTQNTTGNHGQDVEEESSASEGETETIGKPTGKTPDTQNVQNITEL